MANRPRHFLEILSPGAWIILAAGIISSVAVAVWPVKKRETLQFWLFSPPNLPYYQAAAEEWNARHPAPGDHLDVTLFHFQALERRVMAAFSSHAPTADVIETESFTMARAFAGPLEAVGFVDLTDRLRAEGLFERIHEASFGLWTTRGRTFGLPHDVHPVLLGYRADIVEAAGIDVSKIETWEDFRREMSPLIQDLDGDGRPDRWILNFWESNRDLVTVLMRQAGAEFFDANGGVVVDTEGNARVLASLVSWIAGPGRFCVDAPDFSAGGDRMRLEGRVLASILPDWQAGTWKTYVKGLSGKVKVMPLPAWERGGRRTSVWGGTCIAIPRTASDVEKSWAVAKHLYLSPSIAESNFRATCILSPVREFWKLPFYHEPDTFFCGQRIGSLYIAAAEEVPIRRSSPYTLLVMERMMSLLTRLKAIAVARDTYEWEPLLPDARRLLAEAQQDLSARVSRNVLFAVTP